MNIIEVSNLTRHYGSDDNITVALNSASFSVRKGDFVSILGPSGSGKSTLLHLIGGVDRPTSGTVRISGRDLYDLPERELTALRREKIGLIYQFFNLIPVLDVEENIVLPLLLGNKQVDKKEVSDLIARLGLDARKDHLPAELSGGQQQRVSIGRALITHPDVILADEPTGNLDKKNSKEIMTLLHELNRDQGQTIVLITHDLEVAMYARRILVMEDGNIIKDYVRRDETHWYKEGKS